VPVLSVSLKVSVAHQLIVLKDGNPATFWFASFSIRGCFCLFNSHRVCIKVLKNNIVKEGHFLIFIKLKLDICLARFLLHCHGFVRYQAIDRHYIEFLFIHVVPSTTTCTWLCHYPWWLVEHVWIIVLLLTHLYQVVKKWRTVNHYYCLLFEFFHNLT
jgi:hypothetical protein